MHAILRPARIARPSALGSASKPIDVATAQRRDPNADFTIDRSVDGSAQTGARSPSRRRTSRMRVVGRGLVAMVLALAMSCVAGGALAGAGRVTDADAPRALPDAGPVSVRWGDPARFSELRGSGNRSEAARGDWVFALAQHLRSRAEPRLAAGERLEIEILDIRRAGDFEPWRGPEFQTVRVMRELHWPRMALRFKRIGADGAVLAEGERTLSDSAYLSRSSTVATGDPLRYEKTMIDRWIAREFGPRTR